MKTAEQVIEWRHFDNAIMKKFKHQARFCVSRWLLKCDFNSCWDGVLYRGQ